MMGPPSIPSSQRDPVQAFRSRSQTSVPLPRTSQAVPSQQYHLQTPPPRSRQPSLIPDCQSSTGFPPFPSSQQESHLRTASQASSHASAGWQRSASHGARPVDSYRPTTSPHRPDGAELYLQSRERKPTAAENILGAISDLSEQMGTLHDACETLRDDNKQLRDQLHDLQTGQRALATREEVTEEVTAQLSPALHDFFASLHEKVDAAVAPLPEQTASLSATKIKLVLAEMREQSFGDKSQGGSSQEPLIGLMNHLISKLDPISNFSEILESLKELPSAVRDVAIFKQGVDGLITTMNQRPQLPSASITSLDVESVSSLKQSFDELRQSVTRGTPPTPQADLPDLNRIREGMEGIAKAVEDLKTGLLTPAVTPSYNSDLSKLLEITAALKQDVVDMKNKIDGPHTPVRPVYDSDAIKQQLGGIDDKLDDLKADLRRTASQKPPLAPFLSNTPASGRLPSPPERPVPPPSPRLPLTQISVPSLSPALTRTSTQIHSQARPEASVDIFGPKIRIPAPAITTERKDPFDWMEDLLTSCSPEVSDRPPHTESNKSSRGSRVQSKKARVNPPADPGLVIRTRAMKANEEPIYVSSDSTAGRNNSANSVTVDNNTQTVSGPSTQVTMAPFDVGSLPGGVRRTPTGRFGKTPKTYGSGDKKKSGKKRFSSDE